MAQVCFQNIEDRVRCWLNQNHPELSVIDLNLIAGGQTNLCYLVNGQLVLKIYLSKSGVLTGKELRHFRGGALAQEKLSHLSFTPRVIGVYENDEILKANAVLMEYVQGVPLIQKLQGADEKKQYRYGKNIAKLLKKLHSSHTVPNQLYDTEILKEKAMAKLYQCEKAKCTPKKQARLAHRFLESYQPKDLNCDFVVLHKDTHFENFLVGKRGSMFLIDFDSVTLGPRFLELQKILTSTFASFCFLSPAQKLDYQNKTFIPLLKGLLDNYKKITDNGDSFDEIKLLALTEALSVILASHYDSNHSTTLQKIGLEMFNLVMEQDVLKFT